MSKGISLDISDLFPSSVGVRCPLLMLLSLEELPFLFLANLAKSRPSSNYASGLQRQQKTLIVGTAASDAIAAEAETGCEHVYSNRRGLIWD